MVLQVLATGSAGNVYLLQAGEQNETLILDAGLPLRRVMCMVKCWRSVVGCLITHEHQDHAKSAEDIAMLGIPTYATKGTIEAIQAENIRPAAYLQAINIGNYTVMPFETRHDAAEPCGYLIRYDPTGETAVYATDTYYLPNTFPGINYWLVECNYTEEHLQEQIESGELPPELRARLLKSHMSLRRLSDTLQANDLSDTAAIILIHLSDSRGDEPRMIETIKAIAPPCTQVEAAQAGHTYRLSKEPF